MLSWIPIRWRITLFHILTMLGIAALLSIGMFAVFGIAVTSAVEQLARSRANEAARVVETTGALSPNDLASLARDGVQVVALDGEGRVVAQFGTGVAVGELVESGLWRQVLGTGEGRGGDERGIFEAWDDRAAYIYAVPVQADRSSIRVIEAVVNYDRFAQGQYQEVTFAFVGFGLLAFVLITIGSIWLVRYSLAPMTAIAQRASEISAADFSARLPVRSRRDELGHLALTFNALLDRLESAFSDREEALAHQRRFVADASHELRTPLTSLLGYTRLLKQWGMRHPAASAEALERMEIEATRMQSLVEGLLQLARGDEIDTVETTREDLVDVVREAVGIATGSAPGGAMVVSDLPDQAVPVEVDRAAIQQVVTILLDNARKVAPAGSEIRVTVGQDGTIVVTDAGPGIAAAHQARIFERFYRAEQSRTTRGAGLGLAIAHDIVTRHGGTIAVTSAPGEGATFTVRLPLAGAARALPGMTPS